MRHSLYEELDSLSDMIGGRFQLTVLLQKRLRELSRGAPPYVDMETEDHMAIAIAEIKSGVLELTRERPVTETLKEEAGTADAEPATEEATTDDKK